MTIEQANCHEMKKLKKWLDENNIAYECKDAERSPYAMARVHFYIGEKHFSCIHGYGSYGGETVISSDEGLLELYQLNGESDPIGFLTVEDVIKEVTK